jgi:periplasmic protein TonB
MSEQKDQHGDTAMPPDRGARKGPIRIDETVASHLHLERAEQRLNRDPRDRKWLKYGFLVAVIFHAGVLAARIPTPEQEPERIEEEVMQVQFLRPPPPPPPPPEEPPPEPPPPKEEPQRIPMPDPTPPEPEPEPEPPPPPPIPVQPDLPPIPFRPPEPPPQPQAPVRVAPGEAPGLIKRVEPEYPRVAQAARMQGLVIVDAVIGTDGTVKDAQVIRSAHPILDQAAVEAVLQWRYSPFPYDVILTVTVNFSLR